MSAPAIAQPGPSLLAAWLAGPGWLGVWWRALANRRVLLTGVWLGLGWMALSSISMSLSVDGPDHPLWRANFLLGMVPSWVGLWCCQAVQDLEHRRCAWLLPHLHAVNRRGLTVAALVAAALALLLHRWLGGSVPAVPALAFALMVFASHLNDLGWNGTGRDRLLAWSPFVVILALIAVPGRLAAWMTAWPVAATILCLLLAAVWTTGYWPMEMRRRRVLLPVIYLTSLAGDETALRRRWFAGRGDPRKRNLRWVPGVDLRTLDQNLLQALHGYFPLGLVTRSLLVSLFAIGAMFIVAFGNGWRRGGLTGGLEWFAHALWGNNWGRPIMVWVDLLLLAYFVGTAAAMVLLQFSLQPHVFFRTLPLGRASRTAAMIRLGNHHHGAFIFALLGVGGAAALALAATGYANVGPGLPHLVSAALAVWALLPLGQAILEGWPRILGKGGCGASWGAKLAVFLLMVGVSMLLACDIDYLDSEFGLAVALSFALALLGIHRWLRNRILRRRLAVQDLV